MRQLILLLGLALLLGSCAKNIAPTCVITSPANNAAIEKGTSVTISADAEDEDGNLSEVRFYIDNAGVSSSSSFPYSYSWSTSDVSTGSHTIKATALDEKGLEASDNITVTICGSSVTDIDGNTYSTVQIGNQCWMAANLKVTKYPSGTSIPNVTDITAWANLGDNGTDDAYCYYNNNTSGEANTYGALYTWAAAMGDNAVSSSSNPSGVQGVCPTGWHLPSDAEWTELTDYLGGESVAGEKMKEAGTNSIGFIGLLGGYRDGYYGSFNDLGSNGFFWSATATEAADKYAWGRMLPYFDAYVKRYYYNKAHGFSVRCLSD